MVNKLKRAPPVQAIGSTEYYSTFVPVTLAPALTFVSVASASYAGASVLLLQLYKMPRRAVSGLFKGSGSDGTSALAFVSPASVPVNPLI